MVTASCRRDGNKTAFENQDQEGYESFEDDSWEGPKSPRSIAAAAKTRAEAKKKQDQNRLLVRTTNANRIFQLSLQSYHHDSVEKVGCKAVWKLPGLNF